jgi:hypothetical protein
MNGGLGNDFYFVDSIFDVATDVFFLGGIDTVQSSVSFTLSANIENLNLVGLAVTGTGNALNNVINDNALNNVNGLGGSDTLNGNAGNDTLNGGDGSDTLNGGDGNDTMNGGAGNDALNGGANNDVSTGGPGRDTHTGGAGNDIFNFDSTAESPPNVLFLLNRDVVTDFNGGGAFLGIPLAGDQIDLVTIDANVLLLGNQAVGFVGGAAADSAGELRYAGGLIQGNTDADLGHRTGDPAHRGPGIIRESGIRGNRYPAVVFPAPHRGRPSGRPFFCRLQERVASNLLGTARGAPGRCHRATTVMDEADRRKQAISRGETDIDRWADPDRLEASWQERSLLAAGLVAAGSRVLDIGCGAMTLEKHLPFGCQYRPCDVIARDARTIVVDLNRQPVPQDALASCDLVVMLGVWEYLFRPHEIFAALACAGRPVVCSYCPVELSAHLDRRALGWVNDLSLAAFLELGRQYGYRPALERRIDDLQYVFKLEKAVETDAAAVKRVHVVSYNNVGNFGDRLGFHLLNEALPPNAQVSWGTLRPFAPVPESLDLLVIGIGNSLFDGVIDEPLIEAAARARASIGIFGTQYREALPAARLDALIDRLTHWYARYEEDLLLYGRSRPNASHLGDWLINAFPLASGVDDRVLHIGQEIWRDLPLDRTIQRIQRHRKVFSERLHPLLCALTSADEVGYKEQRESADRAMPSGKFRSMLIDIFGQTYPEGRLWRVDRGKVAAYKTRVRRNTQELGRQIAALLA